MIFLPIITAVLGYYGAKRWGAKFTLAEIALVLYILFGSAIKDLCYPPVPFIESGEMLTSRNLNHTFLKQEEWVEKNFLRP